MSGQVRALILDYGGVLSRPQHTGSVQHMAELLNQDYHDLIQVYRSRRAPYDSGLVSGKEYWRGVLEHYGIKPDDVDISCLISHDIQSWTQINEPMVRFVTEVRGRIHRLAILSNITRETLAFMRRNFHWLELFDECVFSCEVGTSKPDRDIYEHCLGKLKVRADQCLFVDDSAENVRGAEVVGMSTLQFRTLAEFQVELDQFDLIR
jgi:putative hydrolase of the HAD superfamily